MNGSDEQCRVVGAKVIARAWNDENFKQRLHTDTKAALKECGFEVPEGITVKAVENTENLIHLVIPQAPADGELSEEDLEQVSAAGGFCCCWD